LTRERRRIEDRYTYAIKGFGRVIFNRNKAEFAADIERFKKNVEEYCWIARNYLTQAKSRFHGRLVEEYFEKYKNWSSKNYEQFDLTDDDLKVELQDLVATAIDDTLLFEEPIVRVVYKDITIQSIDDQAFRNELETAMRRKGRGREKVPIVEIKSLFGVGDAAPARPVAKAAL
jgi:hypothetical protein